MGNGMAFKYHDGSHTVTTTAGLWQCVPVDDSDGACPPLSRHHNGHDMTHVGQPEPHQLQL